MDYIQNSNIMTLVELHIPSKQHARTKFVVCTIIFAHDGSTQRNDCTDIFSTPSGYYTTHIITIIGSLVKDDKYILKKAKNQCK